MEFQRILALRGPNIWANYPVLEAWVDLQGQKDIASNEQPGFNERLKTWLPGLYEHRCSVGEPGGFFQRLDRGTYLAHILEHVALELQALAGSPLGYGRTRMADDEGVYKVVVAYEIEELGRAALESARELLLAAWFNKPFEVQGTIDQLRELYAKIAPRPEVAALLEAARLRRIPARLSDAPGLIEFGYGTQRRRFWEGQTDKTSAVAASTAYDFDLARNLMKAVGVPTTQGQPAKDAGDARVLAEGLGLPVTLRHQYLDQRTSRPTICTTLEEVSQAYETLYQQTYYILVEKALAGRDFHLLLVGDRVVGGWEETARGSAWIDIKTIHAETARRVLDAARVLGLDVATIHVVADDLGHALEPQSGAIYGVQSRLDLKAVTQKHRAALPGVAGVILDYLYPESKTARIPTVCVTGVNGKTTTTRLMAHILRQVIEPVGITCTEGIWLGERRLYKGDCSGPKSAKWILHHPEARAAVLECARGGILREGLGFDRCHVAIVTNIGEGDHLNSDIDTPERLAYVKSTAVAAVLKDQGYAVLNAADPLVVDMAQYCKGKVIYFARDPHHPVVEKHREAGGRAVLVKDHHIVFGEGNREVPLISLDRVPLTQKGRIGFHVENALAAAAGAWGLEMPLDAVRSGLESFSNSTGQTPCRFNILDVKGTTVVLDYGHNVSALRCLIETLAQLPNSRRTIVYSAAGDRRDSDMVDQGKLLGDAFDRVVLYEDTYLRGRKEGEIFALFREGMRASSRVKDVLEVRGGLQAVDAALKTASPGELIVIQPDLIENTVEYLTSSYEYQAREIGFDEAVTKASQVNITKEGAIDITANQMGKAVYATRTIKKGEVLLQAWGPRIPTRTQHSIQVDNDLHILPPIPLALLNHSCSPNCGLVIRRGTPLLELHARRDIAVGEELTLDYATFEWEIKFMPGKCLCGESTCRSKIVGYKGLSKADRDAYGPYVAEYLREMDHLVDLDTGKVTPARDAQEECLEVSKNMDAART